MASSKTLFGEDPLDRRHGAGGLAEPCPQCGARQSTGQAPEDDCCWFCECRLSAGGFEPVAVEKADDTLAATHAPNAGLQFSIGTMLLVTTLVAICLAITMAIPVLGVIVSVIAIGGIVRTTIVGWAHVRAGRRFEIPDKIEEFFVSSTMFVAGAIGFFGTVTIVAICAIVMAFVVAEFSPLFAILFLAAIPLGIAAGVFAFIRVYLTFAPAVRKQIASAEPPRLNQMSGTIYRHRPK